MPRLLFAALLLVAVVAGTRLEAQSYREHPHHRVHPHHHVQPHHHVHPFSGGYRDAGTWQQQSPWGYPRGTTGYRFGYLYDPYASGSFRAPDLMDDPSFRAKQRVGRLFYSEPRRP